MADVIRLAVPSDAAAIRAIYAPFVESTPITFETRIFPVEDFAAAIEETNRTHTWLVLERDGEVIGYARGTAWKPYPAYAWSVEVTIYLEKRARGAGAGTRLMTELLERLTEIGYVNAFAAIALPNPGSTKLFESLGFTKVGIQEKVGFKLGAWHDVGLWQKSLAGYPDEPRQVPANQYPADS